MTSRHLWLVLGSACWPWPAWRCSPGLMHRPGAGQVAAAAHRRRGQRRCDHQPGPDRPDESRHRHQRPAQRRRRRGSAWRRRSCAGSSTRSCSCRRPSASASDVTDAEHRPGDATRSPSATRPPPRSCRSTWPIAASIRARCASSCGPRSPGSRCVGRELRPRIVVTQEQIDLALKRSARPRPATASCC